MVKYTASARPAMASATVIAQRVESLRTLLALLLERDVDLLGQDVIALIGGRRAVDAEGWRLGDAGLGRRVPALGDLLLVFVRRHAGRELVGVEAEVVG